MTNEREPTLADVIKAAIHYREFDLHVAMPGRIKSYDASTQLADVEVCINPTLKADGGDEVIVLGVISNVPIKFPGGGGYFLSFPLEDGDGVELTFLDRSIDDWLEKGGVVDITDQRMHHLSDASAFPGLRAKPDALTSAHASKLVIGKDGEASMQITIDGTTIKISDNATEFVALAQKVLTELQKITTYLTALDTVWQATIPEAGMGSPSSLATALKIASAAAGGVPSMQSVAASKVKAE